jgi:hypothetical protein
MKIIIATLTIIVGLLALSPTAEARSPKHCGSSYTYRSGHASCGCAIYTKRILSGYDHCRQPIYRYYGVPIVHHCHSKRSTYRSSYGHHNNNYHHLSRYRSHYGNRYTSHRYGSRYGSRYGFRTSFGNIRICR